MKKPQTDGPGQKSTVATDEMPQINQCLAMPGTEGGGADREAVLT